MDEAKRRDVVAAEMMTAIGSVITALAIKCTSSQMEARDFIDGFADYVTQNVDQTYAPASAGDVLQ